MKPPKDKKHSTDKVISHLLTHSKAPISYAKIAEIAQCSRRTAIRHVKKLLAEKVITVESSTYCNTRMCGKNKYSRGPRYKCAKHRVPGYDLLVESIGRHKPWGNRSYHRPGTTFATLKYSFISISLRWSKRQNPRRGEDYKTLEEKSAIMGEHFPYFRDKSKCKNMPQWWFRDLPKLKKVFSLIKQKVKKGFKPKSVEKFITHLLANGAEGFRRHYAKRVLGDIKTGNHRCSPYLEEFQQNIKRLHTHYGLSFELDQFSRFLRKGVSHLALSAKVTLTRLKLSKPIKDINSFLQMLVNMDNPFDYLKVTSKTL